MSDQADDRQPVERPHGGDQDEFIGEEIITREDDGFEGEHGERGDDEDVRHGDDAGPM